MRPGGPPINVQARPLSSTQLLVTWNSPLQELRHGEIQGFNVGFRETGTPHSSNYNFSSVPADNSEPNEYILTGLEKYTRYTIVVRAFNQVGPGPLSDPFTVQTMEDGKIG